MDQTSPRRIRIPAKYASWLLSLIGGSLMVAYWAYLNQAGRTPTPPAPAQPGAGVPPVTGRFGGGEGEYEDDGFFRGTPPAQPPVATRQPSSAAAPG